MSRSFTWIFWGLLFSCLDLKINGFDLLVDLLGYVFVAIGCYGLPRQSPRFRLAGHLAVVMAFLEVVAMTTGNPGDLFKLAWYGFQIAMVWTPYQASLNRSPGLPVVIATTSRKAMTTAR